MRKGFIKIDNYTDALAYLHKFSKEHDITVSVKGECGFGRPCVGLIKTGYISYNPYNHEERSYYRGYHKAFYNTRPENAYHKYNCFAVTTNGEDSKEAYEFALIDLANWIKKLQVDYKISLVTYTQRTMDTITFFTGDTKRYAFILSEKEVV